jgi:crossover junction endodeoxyribonuclease RuvC
MEGAMTTTYIGVDPGLSGAIAFLRGGEAWVEDMPVGRYSDTGKVKNAVDLAGVKVLLKAQYDALSMDRPVLRLYLERVSAMPGQGVASMFSLGMSYWGVAGVAAALEIPVALVTPQEWKKHFRLGKDKDQARMLAARMFPGIDLHRQKDHGRAEALLIAEYGRIRWEGK